MPRHHPQVTIIICHGFLGNKTGGGRAVAFGKKATQRGYGVLRFDFHGSGDSEGNFEDITLSNYLQDLESAVDFTEDQGLGKIVVLGRSFGGDVAICQAARDQRIQGVCTWGSPISTINTLRNNQPEEYQRLLEGKTAHWKDKYGHRTLRPSFLTDLRKHEISREAKKISPRPLLIVHGDQDATVNVEDAYQLYRAADEPKELAIISGANHQFLEHQQKLQKITFTWLEKFFPVVI